jgi:hypothetical protein
MRPVTDNAAGTAATSTPPQATRLLGIGEFTDILGLGSPVQPLSVRMIMVG